MNKWHGVSILFLIFAGDLGLLRYSKACNIISSIQCANFTNFFWCVDNGQGTLVPIGEANVCPDGLVCDDTQAIGCVLADTVTTTELTYDSTTAASTGVANDTDWTTTEQSTAVSDADFVCIYEGLYSAQDCSRFHVCYKIIWFMKHYFARCSEGLYWSSREKRCVIYSLSDCQYRTEI